MHSQPAFECRTRNHAFATIPHSNAALATMHSQPSRIRTFSRRHQCVARGIRICIWLRECVVRRYHMCSRLPALRIMVFALVMPRGVSSYLQRLHSRLHACAYPYWRWPLQLAHFAPFCSLCFDCCCLFSTLQQQPLLQHQPVLPKRPLLQHLPLLQHQPLHQQQPACQCSH